MTGTVADWARRRGISRQAAYKLISTHGIPFTSPGRVDLEAADLVVDQSINPIRKRGGDAGGSNGKEHSPASLPLFDGLPADPAPAEDIARPPAASTAGLSPLAKVQLRAAILDVQQRELKLEEARGNLISKASVRTFVSNMVTQVKQQLLVIPSELRDDLFEAPSPADCERIVRDRIEKALAALSQAGQIHE